jgi:hypothetical protein
MFFKKEKNIYEQAGSRKQEAGSRKQEAGSRKQEAGSRKLYCPFKICQAPGNTFFSDYFYIFFRSFLARRRLSAPEGV